MVQVDEESLLFIPRKAFIFTYIKCFEDMFVMEILERVINCAISTRVAQREIILLLQRHTIQAEPNAQFPSNHYRQVMLNPSRPLLTLRCQKCEKIST